MTTIKPETVNDRTISGVGGTVGSESAMRTSGILLSRVRAPQPTPWPDGESLLWTGYIQKQNKMKRNRTESYQAKNRTAARRTSHRPQDNYQQNVTGLEVKITGTDMSAAIDTINRTELLDILKDIVEEDELRNII
ncbi:hypothetical protein PoB_007680300 [Plakobranchus ocellatus]|uniref:Uncharacterized protein n=1 Tax=Plakobranchus ocellatus TaxID=259542 RepID=A0AAV4E154_9GAST|nr:hypothetical protein PoB_007680300 [Plakobranchus ocellatus]